MMLVEIIMGKATGDKALATALDYVRAIRKTPIVVNDARGFFANRCVGAYILEGHLMLAEGVPAAMIENVGRMAGMPVGPLSLNDEVAVDLAWKILKATEADLGAAAIDPRQKTLLEEMVEKRGRYGRKNAKGFYDYPQSGETVWPGLAELQPKARPDKIDVQSCARACPPQGSDRARSRRVVTDVPRRRRRDTRLGTRPIRAARRPTSTDGHQGCVELCKSPEEHGARFKRNLLLTGGEGRELYACARAGPPRRRRLFPM